MAFDISHPLPAPAMEGGELVNRAMAYTEAKLAEEARKQRRAERRWVGEIKNS